jgi:hypothetical protein
VADFLQNGYTASMAATPQPKATTEVSASQLEQLANELADFAERVRLAAQTASDQPEKSLAIYNWASVHTGLRLLRGFVAKADESRSAARLGSPLAVGQLKPRSTAKKQADPDLAEELDELDKEMEKTHNRRAKNIPEKAPAKKKKA